MTSLRISFMTIMFLFAGWLYAQNILPVNQNIMSQSVSLQDYTSTYLPLCASQTDDLQPDIFYRGLYQWQNTTPQYIWSFSPWSTPGETEVNTLLRTWAINGQERQTRLLTTLPTNFMLMSNVNTGIFVESYMAQWAITPTPWGTRGEIRYGSVMEWVYRTMFRWSQNNAIKAFKTTPIGELQQNFPFSIRPETIQKGEVNSFPARLLHTCHSAYVARCGDGVIDNASFARTDICFSQVTNYSAINPVWKATNPSACRDGLDGIRIDANLFVLWDQRNTNLINEQCDWQFKLDAQGNRVPLAPGESCSATCQVTQAPPQPSPSCPLHFAGQAIPATIAVGQSASFSWAILPAHQATFAISGFRLATNPNFTYINPIANQFTSQPQVFSAPGTQIGIFRIVNRVDPSLFADCEVPVIVQSPDLPRCELLTTSATPNPAILVNGVAQVTFVASTPSPFVFTRFRVQGTLIDGAISPQAGSFSRQVTISTPGIQTWLVTVINPAAPTQSIDCPIPVLIQAPQARCGDGVVDPGEQCDDGNTNPGDGCSAVCTLETPTCPLPAFLQPTSSVATINTPIVFQPNQTLAQWFLWWYSLTQFRIVRLSDNTVVFSPASFIPTVSFTPTQAWSLRAFYTIRNNIPASQISSQFQNQRPTIDCPFDFSVEDLPVQCALEVRDPQTQLPRTFTVWDDRSPTATFDQFSIVNLLGQNPPNWVRIRLIVPSIPGGIIIHTHQLTAEQRSQARYTWTTSLPQLVSLTQNRLTRNDILANPLTFEVEWNFGNPNIDSNRQRPPTASSATPGACNISLPVQPEGDRMLINGQVSQTYPVDAIPQTIPFTCDGWYGDRFDLYMRVQWSDQWERIATDLIPSPALSSPSVRFSFQGSLPAMVRTRFVPWNTYEFRCDTRSPRIVTSPTNDTRPSLVRDLAYTSIARISIGWLPTCLMRVAPNPAVIGQSLSVYCETSNQSDRIVAWFRPVNGQFQTASLFFNGLADTQRWTGTFASIPWPQGLAHVWCYRVGLNNWQFDPIPNCTMDIAVQWPICINRPLVSNNWVAQTSFVPGNRFAVVCDARNFSNPRILIRATAPLAWAPNAPVQQIFLDRNSPWFSVFASTWFAYTAPWLLPTLFQTNGLVGFTQGMFYDVICMDGNTPLEVQVGINPPSFDQCSTRILYAEQPVCLGLEPSKPFVSYTASMWWNENVFDVVAMLGWSQGQWSWRNYVAYARLYIQWTDHILATGSISPASVNIFFTGIRVNQALVVNAMSRDLRLNPTPMDMRLVVRFFDAQGNEITPRPSTPDFPADCSASITVIPECTDAAIQGIEPQTRTVTVTRWSTQSVPMLFTGWYSSSLTLTLPSPLNPLTLTISSDQFQTPNVFQTLRSSHLYRVDVAWLGSLPRGTYGATWRVASSLVSGLTPQTSGYQHFMAIMQCPVVTVNVVDPGMLMVRKVQRNVTANSPAWWQFTGWVIRFASGDQVSYQLIITNSWAAPLTAVTVREQFPAQFGFGSQISTCQGISFDQSTTTWTIPTLAANASCTITITGQIVREFEISRSEPVCSDVIRNTVLFRDASMTQDAQIVLDAQLEQPRLSISKQFLSWSTAIGQQGQFRLIVRNDTALTGWNVVVSDPLPYGIEIIGIEPSWMSIDLGGRWVRGRLASFAPHSSVVITGTYRVILDDSLSGQLLTNTWFAQLDCQLPVSGSATVRIDPRLRGALSVAKFQRNVTRGGVFTTWSMGVALNDTVVYDLVIGNSGQATIASLDIVDSIDPSIFALTASSSSGHPVTQIEPLRRRALDVPAWASIRLLLTWTVIATGTELRNTVRATDSDGNQWQASVVAFFSSLTLDKTQRLTGTAFGDQQLQVMTGTTLIYRLAYTNRSLIALTNVELIDELPRWFTPTQFGWGQFDQANRRLTRNLGTLFPWQSWFVIVTWVIDQSFATYVNTWLLRADGQEVIDTVTAVGPYPFQFVKQQRNASSGTDFTSQSIVVADGQRVDYRLWFRNDGLQTVTLNLLDVLPLGYTPIAWSWSNGLGWTDFSQVWPWWSDNPFQRTWTVDILPGSEYVVVIQWVINTRWWSLVSFRNRATACITLWWQQQCRDAEVVAGIPPFIITKARSLPNPRVGDVITYEITRRNITDRRIFTYTVTDVLPPTLDYVAGSTRRALRQPNGSVVAEWRLADVWWNNQFVRWCGNTTNGRLLWLAWICPMEVWQNSVVITFQARVR